MAMSLRKCTAMLLLITLVYSTTTYADESAAVIVPPINTPATSQHIPGKIIWHDLVTDNVSAAQQFYAKLFGWKFKTYGSGKDTYICIFYKERPIGGIVPLTPKQAAENANQWVSYISVPDVVQATQFVKKNGGKVLLEPMKYEQQGELAVFTDPEGAVFGVIKSSSGDPVNDRLHPGGWIWTDLMVNNPQRAIQFYQGIAGYQAREYTRDAMFKGFYLFTDKVARAGVADLSKDGQGPEILPNWLPYIYVSNLDAAVARTTSLGGRIILNPATEVFNGHLAVIADPGGAALGLVELKLSSKK